MRAHYKEGADLIKVTATGGVLSQARSGQNAQFTEDELRAIVSTAKDYGFRVAAHAHGTEGIKRALRAGVDSIEHGTLMDDEAIALFKKHGAWYVPTISAGRYVADKAKIDGYYSPLVQPKAAAIGPLIQATFGRAYRAGVKIAFGTDAGGLPARRQRQGVRLHGGSGHAAARSDPLRHAQRGQPARPVRPASAPSSRALPPISSPSAAIRCATSACFSR